MHTFFVFIGVISVVLLVLILILLAAGIADLYITVDSEDEE